MSWAATTSGYTGDMVRDVMLQAIESRFAGALKADSEIEWLSDNGSCYIADETLTFSRGNRPEAGSRHRSEVRRAMGWPRASSKR